MSDRLKRIDRSQDRFAQAEAELLSEIPRWRFKLRKRVRLNAELAREVARQEKAAEMERVRSKPRALKGIAGRSLTPFKKGTAK